MHHPDRNRQDGTIKRYKFDGNQGGCHRYASQFPVQERTLHNANGGTITCKQVGDGPISFELGKERYDKCVADAKAQGYT